MPKSRVDLLKDGIKLKVIWMGLLEQTRNMKK